MSLCSHLYSLVKNLHNKFKINANWTASETFFLYLNIHGDFCVTSFRQNFTTYNATAFWNIANALWYLNHGNSVFPFWPAWIMYLQNLRPCSRSTKYPNGSQFFRHGWIFMKFVENCVGFAALSGPNQFEISANIFLPICDCKHVPIKYSVHLLIAMST